MKFSVVIPTYNRGLFIRKAVESVLSQSYRDYELIVVDDGSTDETSAVLCDYKTRIRYVRQNNFGVGAARNAGIRMAEGEWIAFLDSDDEWSPDYLLVQSKQILSQPRAVAHITNAVTVSPGGERVSLFTETGFDQRFCGLPSLYDPKPLHLILRFVPWFLQSTVLSRALISGTRMFEESISIAEDIDVLVRAALEGGFTFTARPLVDVHRRTEPMLSLSLKSREDRVVHYQSFERVYLRLLQSRKLTLPEAVLASRALSQTRRALGNAHITRGHQIDARKCYARSLVNYPTIGGLLKYFGTYLPIGYSRSLLAREERTSDRTTTGSNSSARLRMQSGDENQR